MIAGLALASSWTSLAIAADAPSNAGAPLDASSANAGPDDTGPADATSDAAADENTIVVNGQRQSKLEATSAILSKVAGGTAVIDNELVEKSAILTNADVLAFVPGVYAQAGAGSDAIKISIRGSSVNRGSGFFRSGALFEFDGLPVTGPGGTPYELFEPLGLSRTEVLRGANGFDRGSVTLGGVINYISLTGEEASPLGVRLETGSYGYKKYQVTSGGKYGKFDYYVSATGSHRDGYQDQSRGRSFGVAGNIGIEITPDIKTRFYGRYRRTANESPGQVSEASILNTPRAANPVQVLQNADRIQPGSVWLANKTTFTLDSNSSLELGGVYHNYPIDQQLGVNRGKWAYTDITGSLRYIRNDTIFGRQSDTTIGLLYTTHPKNGSLDNFVRIPTGPTAGLAVGTLIRRTVYGGTDGNAYFTNETEPVEGVHFLVGGSLIRIKRSSQVVFPVITGLTTPYSRSSWDYGYRLGLRYEATPEIQFFGNISRSVEPPNDWAFVTISPAGGRPAIPAGYPAAGLASGGIPLKDQTGTTFEIGGRGKSIFGAWSLSVYRAQIKNELLSVEVQAATATLPQLTVETNASPTVHQGVEAGLDSALWRSDKGIRIGLRQSYTFNDFHFRNDPLFKDNQLPSIPKHYYEAQLSFDHPSGIYATAGTTVASKNFRDYANSRLARHYQLWNATIGFDIPETSYRIFADFQNIGNKHYAAVISPLYNLKGVDGLNLTPGDGFTVTGGVSFSF